MVDRQEENDPVLQLFPWIKSRAILQEQIDCHVPEKERDRRAIQFWCRFVGLGVPSEKYTVIAQKAGVTHGAACALGAHGLSLLQAGFMWNEPAIRTPMWGSRPRGESVTGTIIDLFFKKEEGRQGVILIQGSNDVEICATFKAGDCVPMTPFHHLRIGHIVTCIVQGTRARMVESQTDRERGRASNQQGVGGP